MTDAARALRPIYPELDAQLTKEETLRKVLVVSDLIPLLGLWVKPLTPRIRARLELAGSPFLDGRRAMLGDVALFLWLVSPRWTPDYLLRWWRTPLAWAERKRIEFVVARCDLWAFEVEIRRWMLDNMQDSPGTGRKRHTDDADDDVSDPGPACYGPVASAAFASKQWGLSFDEYLDTPYLLLNQFYRVYLHSIGMRGTINESDRMTALIIKDLHGKGEE